MTILRVALDVPLDKLFDYLDGGIPVDVGQRVLVPFGPRKLVGVVLEKRADSQMAEHRLKPILQVFNSEPTLSSESLFLFKFCSEYYQYPLGQAILSTWPSRLREARPAILDKPIGYRLTQSGSQARLDELPKRAILQRRLWQKLSEHPYILEASLIEISKTWRVAIKPLLERGWVERIEIEEMAPPGDQEVIPGHALNEDQQQAVDAITTANGSFSVFLLHGITGSGKTEVYMRLLQQVLKEPEAQVLVLVPEINLTPQLEGRFLARFPGEIMVSLHSQMSDGDRLRNWRLAESGRARIVIGTRLSVFTPIPNLRLIVVDEEHDASYKQQDGMRYSARDVAVMRAKQKGIPVVLGSATPSLETWHNAISGRYRLLKLAQRAVATAQLPEIICLDTRLPNLRDGLTPRLIEALKQRMASGEQSLLFINRRGYSPVLLCSACAWVAPCHRCSSRLVVHLREKRLRCHHCGHEERFPLQCPSCGNPDLRPTGQGTQRLEASLAELMPKARILRVDRDSMRRKSAVQEMTDLVHANEIDILVGTQMLAKGHDFPNLTLVGVIDTDGALFSPDYRAGERMFAQLMQVSGRAGRADKPGQVLIQTAFPDHILFQALKCHDYAEYAATLLEERKNAHFPPYCHEALLRAEATSIDTVRDFLRKAGELAEPLAQSVTVFDAVRPQMERLQGLERMQMLVQSDSRSQLQSFLQQWVAQLRGQSLSGKVRWSLDVGPLEY